MVKPLLITIIVEAVLLAAGGVIDKLFPISSLWIWLGVVAIGAPFLVTMIWRERNARRRAPSSPAARVPVSPTETVHVVDVSVPESAPISRRSAPDRVYTPRTLDEIFDSVANLTMRDVKHVEEKYLGQWIIVTKEVDDITEHEDDIGIFTHVDEKHHLIYLEFRKKDWEAALRTVQKGDRVTVEGKFNKLRRSEIDLDECELIEVKGQE